MCNGSTVKLTFLTEPEILMPTNPVFSVLTPLVPEFLMLVYFFSQAGEYQKAFEHLGNVLTYDPGNYKVG